MAKIRVPDVIYLIDPCGEFFEDGVCTECGDTEGFCDNTYDDGPYWCADRQNATDVAYKKIEN